jgi:Lrp/AsnC family transcriptional regulator, leucine-responsive regulatory protein
MHYSSVVASDASLLDDTDLLLLSLLEADGRATALELAAKVALTATAVTRRMRRLERNGVITGYSARVDYSKLGFGMEALIEVRFSGKTRPKVMDETTTQLLEVVGVFTTSGNYDALVWIRVKDVAHLREVIDTLRVSPGVTDTRTHIVLASNLRPRGGR